LQIQAKSTSCLENRTYYREHLRPTVNRMSGGLKLELLESQLT
jgi:hypothetical protein